MKCLWIEDFDKGTKPNFEEFWKKLYELPQKYDLILKKNLTSALDHIDNIENDFDSVIIDINLDCKDEELGVNYKGYLQDVVSEKLLNKEQNDIEKAGGFLIFLKLILDRGFPRERMAFLTGNYSEKDAEIEVVEEILEIIKDWDMDTIVSEHYKTLSSSKQDNFDILLNELEDAYDDDVVVEIEEKLYKDKTEDFISHLKELHTIQKNKVNDVATQNTYNEYKTIFTNAGINPSKPYIKQGFDEQPPIAIKRHTRKFKKWLNDMDTNYHCLRRSIIEISEALLYLLEENENLFIFNSDNNFKSEVEEIYGIEEIKSMLHLLRGLLPLKEPSQIQKQKLYKQIIRIISHYWEIKNPYYPSRFKKDRYYENICCVMKLLRNWMAHNKIKEEFNEADIGFFFILAMRTYFNLANKLEESNEELDKIRYYEIKLLQLQDEKCRIGELIGYFKFNRVKDDERDAPKSKLEQILKLSFTNITKKEMEAFKNSSLSKDNAGYNVYTKMKNIGNKRSKTDCSINDLYKLFWHSIFYSWLDSYSKSSEDLTKLIIKFGFADRITRLDESEILTQIFMCTFHKTFSKEIEKLDKQILTQINDKAIC